MLKYVRVTLAAAGMLVLGLGMSATAQTADDVAARMDQMEEQMRQLVGQVEALTFEVKQLKSQLGQTNSGAAEPLQAPQGKPRKLATDAAPASDGGNGIETIQDQPLGLAQDESQGDASTVDQPLGESDVTLNKAPGPRILGTLKGSNGAAQNGDGGFQGKVLVAPGQQDPGDDASVIQDSPAVAADGGGTGDNVETVSVSPELPEALYERSNEALLRRQFGDAEAGFGSFLQKYPDHSLAGSAQYWLGETYYAQNDFRQAAQAFLKGYRQYPDSRRAADSLLKLGISLGRLGQQQQACAAYVAVSSEYPKSVEARKRAQAEAKRAGCAS